MSSMFGGGFKASKCKTLLRLAMARIKLLRNKRDMQVKQMRKEIAQLLSSGQEPSARIRVEHIYREQNIMAAYDILELFCELIIVRLPIIESQKACPTDLKEGICSLIFASPRCADLPELLQIRSLFTSKYGKDFVAAAAELRPDCGVNRRIIEKLSVRAPSGETKLKLLKEIAAEHNVNWDPADSEAELLKQPEDLLDGPRKFFGTNDLPIPEPLPAGIVKPQQGGVPQQRRAPSGPPPSGRTPPRASPPAPVAGIQMAPLLSSDDEEEEEAPRVEKTQFIPFAGQSKSEGPAGKPSVAGKHQPSVTTTRSVAAPPSTTTTGTVKQEGHVDEDEKRGNYNDVEAAAQAAKHFRDRAVEAARAAEELAKNHPSRKESVSRSASNDLKSSSSEEEDEDSEEDVEPPVAAPTKAPAKSKLDPVQQESSSLFTQPVEPEFDQDKSGEFRRSNSDKLEGAATQFDRSDSGERQDNFFKKNYQEEQSDSFSRWNRSKDQQPEPALNSKAGTDPEQESYWRSGDQDYWRGTSLKPETKRDSGGFFSSYGGAQEGSPYHRDSDPFRSSGSDDAFSRLPRDRDSYGSTSQLYGSRDSSSNLFNRSSSEFHDVRSSDEPPFYDSKQNFATPKFDDEELPYTKRSSFPEEEPPYGSRSGVGGDLFSRKSLDNQRSSLGSPASKPSFNDYWKNSAIFRSDEGEGTSREFSSNLGEERQASTGSSHSAFETHVEDSQDLYREGSGALSSGNYDRVEDAGASKPDDRGETSPIPKSRRTRPTSRSRDKLEGAGGSGGGNGSGIPLPPGRKPKFTEGEVEPDHSPSRSFDGSPNFPPRTSLSFYNTPSMRTSAAPPDRAPPSPGQTSGLERKESPSAPVLDRKDSPSEYGLDRKDSPSAPILHPKIPDYDDLTARFEALKGRNRR